MPHSQSARAGRRAALHGGPAQHADQLGFGPSSLLLGKTLQYSLDACLQRRLITVPVRSASTGPTPTSGPPQSRRDAPTPPAHAVHHLGRASGPPPAGAPTTRLFRPLRPPLYRPRRCHCSAIRFGASVGWSRKVPENLGRLLAEPFGGLLRDGGERGSVGRAFSEAGLHHADQLVGDALEVRLPVEYAEGDGLGVAGTESATPIQLAADGARRGSGTNF